MLQPVQRRARSVHPAGKNATRRLIGGMIDNLDESGGLRWFAGRRGVAIASRNRERCEIDRHADGGKNVYRPPGHFVQAAERDGALDPILSGYSIGDGKLPWRLARFTARNIRLCDCRRPDQCSTQGKAECAPHDHLLPAFP
jgi:hypothetical protein